MNPSTEDLFSAAEKVNAEAIIILPNNSNIIMTAQQVERLSDKTIKVLPTKSVMQAITALVAYDPCGEIEDIFNQMNEEIKQVKYGDITYAVRDTVINGLEIKTGDKIGLVNGEIVTTADNDNDIVLKLLEEMVDEESGLITLLYGNGLNQDEASALKENLQNSYPDQEVEMHWGGQPHYSYYISVE